MNTRASVAVLTLVLAVGLGAVARAGTSSDSRAQGTVQSAATRSAKLETELAAIRKRRLEIESHLTPTEQDWLASIARSQRSAIVDAPESAVRSIGAQIRAQRPNATPQQVDVLTFYVVSSELAKWDVPNKKDSLAELSNQQQLRMQLVMERMQKAADVASRLMKKISETAAGIIQNMK